MNLEGDADRDVVVMVENRHTQRQFAVRLWNHATQLRAPRLTRVGGTLDLQISVDGFSTPMQAIVGISPVAARSPLGELGVLGLDLASMASFSVTLQAGGETNVSLPIPQERSLRGITLHAQALFTVPGSPFLSGTVHSTIVD